MPGMTSRATAAGTPAARDVVRGEEPRWWRSGLQLAPMVSDLNASFWGGGGPWEAKVLKTRSGRGYWLHISSVFFQTFQVEHRAPHRVDRTDLERAIGLLVVEAVRIKIVLPCLQVTDAGND